MRNKLIEAIEAASTRKNVAPFDIGDTVSVAVKIIEGTKERIQPFVGVVIARRGRGVNETFTVRRIVNNEGVERIFPVQSPKITGIEVQRHGKARRSKLYYLRNRVGKARKLRERRVTAETKAGRAGAAAERSPTEKAGRRSERADAVVGAAV